MAFFGHFWAQNAVFFLVMAASKHSITCSKNLVLHVSSELTTLKIGYGALQLTTHAPKMLF